MDLDPHFGLALSARLPLRIQTCAENGPQTAIGGLTRMLGSERFFFEGLLSNRHFTLQIVLLLLWIGTVNCRADQTRVENHNRNTGRHTTQTHSCIHDEILEQRRRLGIKEFTVTPQVYASLDEENEEYRRGRGLLSVSSWTDVDVDRRQSIRIFLNYDAVGHSPDRDCRTVGDIVKLGEPAPSAVSGSPACNPRADPPVYGDCWYNCTLEDISGEDKRKRLHEALGETAAWFRRALSVEPVKGPLRLSGYSACGQDGGVQLPRQYVDEGVMDADLVLLVTTRPTTGNTLAWAVACERDQWGRAIAGHVNVAPRHLTAEAETLLSATLIHEVMHVLGFDPHAFAHFRDERKRRRSEVVRQGFDERLGRMVTRVILPRVVMHSRQHYGAYSEDFLGLELEDGGGRGTAGSHWEKRLLMNEIMTGSVDTRSVVSAMTLALLEDSGWYRANFSVAEQLDWGRNQGVDFVRSRCSDWNGAYYCNSTHSSGCTYNREAEGYCPIVRYNGNLPPWAQYFPEGNKGGQSSLADYCAYFVAYSDGSCTDTNSARSPDRMLGEMRGEDSRCMLSSLVRTGFVRGTLTQGNGCYQHRCNNHSLEGSVHTHATGTASASMENADALLASAATIAVNVTVLISAVDMDSVRRLVYVNVSQATQVLIAQLLVVMNSAVCMGVCAIMEYVNSDAPIMLGIHVKIVPDSYLAFHYVVMSLLVKNKANIVHLVRPVFSSNSKLP
ncbi:hypothetical protein AXG93_3256s1310 [Marchantia polymorpha subsp. ruderalis]|uniref:Leishmanolysin-like peptidase n=1 Tax=Marchantia polymorpha subsp. ruderalis TaxID=1480154 RepID=A0A176VIZ6_MARPO|nr:hypothetical protein AXG93_3256s1310 [Marchantia polymorpha subsp. ruderalis]